jgi:hypothetical protein
MVTVKAFHFLKYKHTSLSKMEIGPQQEGKCGAWTKPKKRIPETQNTT